MTEQLSGTGRGTARHRLAGFLSVGAAAAVLLAACGSSSSSSSSAAGSAPKASKTLLIGESAIKTGPAAVSYVITQGFEGYLNYINGQGGVNGYKFKWVEADNAYDPTQSATAENTLMADNPFAINIVGTVPVSAGAQVATSAGSTIPLLVSADGHLVDQLAKAPGAPPIYGLVPDYNLEGQFDANFALTTLKDTSPAIAYENDSLAQGADSSMTSYIPAHGGKVAANVALTATTTNMVPMATQLQASGAKTVIAWMSSNLLATLQKAAAQIGYSPTWVTPFFALNDGYLKLAGNLANGTYIDGIFPPTSSTDPAVQTFMTQMQSFAPGAATGSGQQGWEMASILVAAIKKATANGASLTQSDFVSALKKLDGTIAFADINFTSGHHWGIDKVGWYQVKNGQFVQTQAPSLLPG